MILGIIVLITCFGLHQEPTTQAPAVREPIEKTIDAYAVSQATLENVDLLAKLLTHECGSDWCSDEMVYYTGYVVMNRVASSEFPNSVREVIYQPGQYCGVGVIENLEYTDRIYAIAYDVVTGAITIPANVVYQANFMQGSGVYMKVQNMYFCYR